MNTILTTTTEATASSGEGWFYGILIGLIVGYYLLHFIQYNTCTDCDDHVRLQGDIENCPNCGAEVKTYTIRRWDLYKYKIQRKPDIDDGGFAIKTGEEDGEGL